MKERLQEFDILRAFCALSVIAIHVTAGFAEASDVGYVWNQAMRYAVPMFIILSGFMLFHADREKQKVSYVPFLQKRFKKVLIPYLLWTTFYVAYASRSQFDDWLVQNEAVIPLALWAKHLVMGTGYVHLYFLLIICQLYILYPLLLRWVRQSPLLALSVSFVVTLASQMMIYLHQTGVLVLPSIGIPYVILFPLWLFFFVFGMLASFWKERWQIKLQGTEWLWVIVWLSSFALLLVDSSMTDTYASSIKPTVILYTVSSYFFFYLLSLRVRIVGSRFNQLCNWLATHSFFIFLLHPLLLNQLVLHMPNWWQQDGGMLLLFGGVSVLSITLTMIASRFRFVTIFGGVYVGR